MENFLDWKERGTISIGIPFLDEPSFNESFRLLSQEGYRVKVLMPDEITSKLDYYHIPDFDGFDTLDVGFSYQNVKQFFKPCSNEIRFILDRTVPRFIENNVKLLVFGHAFYAVMSNYKGQQEQDRYPHKLKVSDKGTINFRDGLKEPVFEHEHVEYVNNQTVLGSSVFYLNHFMLSMIDEVIKEEKPKERIKIL